MLPAIMRVAPNSPSARQGYAEEDGGFGKAEHAGGLLELGVDFFKGGAGGFEDEGEGYGHGGGDCALPGEDQAESEMLLQPLAECAVAAEQDEQVVAHNGGGQHHRQGEDGVEEVTADKAFAGKQPADGDAEDEVEQGRPAGDFERQHQGGKGFLEFGHFFGFGLLGLVGVSGCFEAV